MASLTTVWFIDLRTCSDDSEATCVANDFLVAALMPDRTPCLKVIYPAVGRAARPPVK